VDPDAPVLVIGAGPVGLLLANLLGDAGVPCHVVERETERPRESRAIGVTPPSLELLDEIGVTDELVARGVSVRDAFVHDGPRVLGTLTFRRLRGRYAFILCVPQRVTMGVLESRLAGLPSVRVSRGVEFVGLSPAGHGAIATVRDRATGRARTLHGSLLVGCDGHRSTVREVGLIHGRRSAYRVSFFMADFEDRSPLGEEAHLYFTPSGAIESFPLPCGQRRWIAQRTGEGAPGTRESLVACVRRRTGIDLSGSPSGPVSSWRPERLCCETFASGRVLLCGDAAHVMSPIGGQGMNTGFADAELAARAILAARAGGGLGRLGSRYTFRRRRAFHAAADRAALGMWLGTRTGLSARLGGALMRHVLLRPPVVGLLPRHFAMRTIPYGRVRRGEGVA
jgi:2-polyprenyl-6-methoxyphenol hydroxylase-like FAD-dependent oxidoreductase